MYVIKCFAPGFYPYNYNIKKQTALKNKIKTEYFNHLNPLSTWKIVAAQRTGRNNDTPNKLNSTASDVHLR